MAYWFHWGKCSDSQKHTFAVRTCSSNGMSSGMVPRANASSRAVRPYKLGSRSRLRSIGTSVRSITPSMSSSLRATQRHKTNKRPYKWCIPRRLSCQTGTASLYFLPFVAECPQPEQLSALQAFAQQVLHMLVHFVVHERDLVLDMDSRFL